MPSIADSRRQVKETLAAGPDHDDILASLQDEIDRYNQATDEVRRERPHRKRRYHSDDRSSENEERKARHLRFRFKSGVREPKAKRSKHHRSHRERPRTSPLDEIEDGAAHPFPREPEHDGEPSNSQAFQSSLFDALADDEAAAYWESVYSQPIHVYERPVQHTPTGELESMDDETYAAYVQRKMWEKAHPEVVIERERMEKKRQEEVEAKERRREEFVRKRRREAWERAGRARDDGEDGEERDYVFDFSNANATPENGKSKTYEQETYAKAWSAYLAAWERLKAELSNLPSTSRTESKATPASKRIPWPTLQSRPATKPNIEAFMQRIPAKDSKERIKLLKAERVRWHPDKVQQRFAGAVDEGTMKVVTGVFQVVDGLVELERGKA